MFEKNQDSQILPFFFPQDITDTKLLDYINFTDKEGYSVFITASLSSNAITNLGEYLSIGLKEVKKRFEKTDLPILDRMKASIFQSGDFLANHLVESNEHVEDVDYSVCIVSFKDDIAYVWIDGNLNIRIYRGDESLLVNSENKPQFFGSTNVELGDIFSVTFSDLNENDDSDTEQYVLENSKPTYPALLLDYQVDINASLNEEVEGSTHTYQEIVQEPAQELESISEEVEIPEFEALEREESQPQISTPKSVKPSRFTNQNSKDQLERFKSSLNNIKNSPKLKQALVSLKSFGRVILNILLEGTSKISDFIYTVILRKNNHQLKRFQSSSKKRNLQYLLIAILIFAPTYLLFFRGKSNNPAAVKNNPAQISKNNDQTRASIQTQLQNVQKIYNTDPISVPEFNQSFATLKQEIAKARSAGFSDTAYLDATLREVQGYENKILKVTEITKVDISYNASAIPNAKIVDFSLLGNDVYAIDQTNAQILKSGSSQSFEVFAKDERAADKKLTALTQITCIDNVCYLLDETKGLAVLNLQDKTFSNYSGLADAGKEVKEMIYYPAVKRIYTFVPTQGKVLRYDKIGDAFTAPTQWSKDAGFGADVVDFFIDGSVMELSNTGKLRRFAAGINDTQFTGLGESTIKLGGRLQFAASANPNPARTNRLYIADSDNKMIAVYEPVFKADKSNAIISYAFKGIYKYNGTETIAFDNFGEIILSTDENSIYVLDGNSVHKITTTGV